MAKLRIYGRPLSRTFRVLWMVQELGLDHDHIRTDFAKGETSMPAFLAINPNGRIPAIEIDGKSYWESLAINLYLAKRFGSPLAPRDLSEDGFMTMWSFWATNELERCSLTLMLNRVVLPEGKRDETKADAAIAELRRPLDVLEKHLSDHTHLLADRFTVADLNVAAVLDWAAAPELFEPRPAVANWLNAARARPAYQAAKG